MHHHQFHFREEAQERIRTSIRRLFFDRMIIESFRISFMIPNKVPANMGCTPIGQPIGFNRSRSQPMSSQSWEHPNQALNVWDQFYNAAGPSDPRNSLEMLSHQVRILIKCSSGRSSRDLLCMSHCCTSLNNILSKRI